MAPTCFVCLHFLCIIYQQLKMQGVRCVFVPHVPCASRVKCGRKGDPRTQVTLTESLLSAPGCSSCGPRLLIDTLLLTFVWTVERTAGGFHDDDDGDGACTVFVGAGRVGGAWGGGGPGQEVGCRLAGRLALSPMGAEPGQAWERRVLRAPGGPMARCRHRCGCCFDSLCYLVSNLLETEMTSLEWLVSAGCVTIAVVTQLRAAGRVRALAPRGHGLSGLGHLHGHCRGTVCGDSPMARGWGVRAPGRRPEAGAVLGVPGRAPCASAASCPVQPLFPTPCGTAAVGGTGVSPALAVAGLGGALKDAGRRACPEVCAGVTAQMCDLMGGVDAPLLSRVGLAPSARAHRLAGGPPASSRRSAPAASSFAAVARGGGQEPGCQALCSQPVTAVQELFTRPLEPQHRM